MFLSSCNQNKLLHFKWQAKFDLVLAVLAVRTVTASRKGKILETCPAGICWLPRYCYSLGMGSCTKTSIQQEKKMQKKYEGKVRMTQLEWFEHLKEVKHCRGLSGTECVMM